jgi:GNAT superfamily N-acetyltransferase
VSQEAFRYEPFGQSYRSIARHFRCDEEELDVYLRTRAYHDQVQGLAAVRILYDPNRNRIAGYYTLSSCVIERELLPEEITEGKSRYLQYPATLLGRLARDREYQDQRIGKRLLYDALERSVAATRVVASFALVVDAKTPEAQQFYEHYGLSRLGTQDLRPRLYLPMDTIRQLFPPPGTAPSSKRI